MIPTLDGIKLTYQTVSSYFRKRVCFCCISALHATTLFAGDEKLKSRGKRRQFDSVTDMHKEKTNALGFIDKLMRREKDFTAGAHTRPLSSST
jgi:hypothetical protein